MRKLLTFSSLLLTSSLFADEVSNREATLNFGEKSTLSGKITSFNKDSITLQHPDFKKPVTWDTSKLDSVKLFEPKSQSSETKAIGRLQLFNRKIAELNPNIQDDVLLGGILSIDEKHITLETPYAGILKIKRDFIKSLDVYDTSKLILPSLGHLAQWKGDSKKEDRVAIKGKAFVLDRTQGSSSIMLHRELKLPKKYEVVFETDGALSQTRFDLSLHTNKEGLADGETESITFNCSGYNVSIRHNSSNKVNARQIRNGNRGNFPRGLRSEPGRKKFQFFIDNEKKLYSIYLNGQPLLEDFELGNLDFSKLGKSLSITSRYSQSKLTISNLSVKKWSGNKPSLTLDTNRPALKDQIGKLIKLHNGDSIYGNIKNINEGIARIDTKYGLLKVKLANIQNLDLGITKKNEIVMVTNDARLTFSNGSEFIVQVHEIDQNKIVGTGQAFEGKQEFEISQLEKIEFQRSIYPITAP